MDSDNSNRVDFNRETAVASGELEYPYNNQTGYDLNKTYQPMPANQYQPPAAAALNGEVDYIGEHNPFGEIPRDDHVEIKSELTFNSPFKMESIADNDELSGMIDEREDASNALLDSEQQYLQEEDEHTDFSSDENEYDTSVFEQTHDDESVEVVDDAESFVYEEEPVEEAEYAIVNDPDQFGEAEAEENEIDSTDPNSWHETETVFADNEDLEFQDEMVYEDETLDVVSEDEFVVDLEKGTTEYIDVSAVTNRRLHTGVFIPAGFRKTDKVDMVLYFHGLFANGNSVNGISYYWKTYANIRDCFHGSQRNAILIAPGLTSDPQQSTIKFGKPYALDEYITACFEKLRSKDLITQTAVPGHIILAAHSAGGSPMVKILRGTNDLVKNVIECWGFDCCYNYGWEKLSFVIPFYHYWAHNKGGKMSGPGFRGEALARKSPNFRNVAPRKTTYHQGIIEYAWKNEINSRSWFQKTNASGAIVPPEDVPNFNQPKQVIVGIVTNNPQIDEQQALQLAVDQQVTDKNELTNLVFFLRHRDYLGKKLQSSDAKELRDEWIAIQMNIVTPFLKRHAIPEQLMETSSMSSETSSTGFETTSMTLSNTPIELVKENKSKGLAQVKVAPSVFLKEIVRMAFGDKASDDWFNNFTTITFLGRRLNSDQYLHIEMARHLKQVEKELAAKFGGPRADPAIAGDYLLGTSRESIAASRKVSGTAKYSFHMFGLAIDVNYTGNPFIQTPVRSGRNKKTKKVFRIPSGVVTMNDTLVSATNLMNRKPVKFKYGLSYDEYKAINAILVEYLTLIDMKEKLKSLLLSTTSSQWKGHDADSAAKLIQADLDKLALSVDRWTQRDQLKQKGFLNLSKEFIEGVKLNWGSWYGDMMHFDMRDRGVGKEINKAIKRYVALMNVKSAEDFKARHSK